MVGRKKKLSEIFFALDRKQKGENVRRRIKRAIRKEEGSGWKRNYIKKSSGEKRRRDKYRVAMHTINSS